MCFSKKKCQLSQVVVKATIYKYASSKVPLPHRLPASYT